MTSETKTTAHETRSRLKAALSRVLGGILHLRDVTQQQVADATGASAVIVQRWCDKERPETISLADVAALAPAHPEVARDLLTWAAERTGHELRPVAESGEDRDAMRLVHESLDVIRTVTEAMADGAIDVREARTMLRELDDVDAAMAKTRARLRAIVAGHEASVRGGVS